MPLNTEHTVVILRFGCAHAWSGNFLGAILAVCPFWYHPGASGEMVYPAL